MIPTDFHGELKGLRRGKDVNRNPDALEGQQLWLCTWGTQTALVWARSEEWAEARVRRQVFSRYATQYGVMRRPEVVTSDVHVRLATANDLKRWSDARGPKVSGVSAGMLDGG